MSTAAPQALGQSTNARYGEGQVYIGLPQLYTAMRLQQFQLLNADAPTKIDEDGVIKEIHVATLV